MKQHTHSNSLHFILLAILLMTGVSTFVRIAGQPEKQLTVAIMTAFSYIVWGIFHHHFENDLSWKVVVEYVSLGFLGVVVVWTLIFPTL